MDVIYSSPFYRCIQTLGPFVEKLSAKYGGGNEGTAVVNLEHGISEFYGRARFSHPSPAPISVLQPLFPNLTLQSPAPGPIIVPSPNGESIPQLHDRLAYTLHHLIQRLDADPSGPRTLLLCTHAAAIIAIGRALTGRMPEEEGEEDFRCFTCGVSRFVRREGDGGEGKEVEEGDEITVWDSQTPDQVPDVRWRGDRGVGGGWVCEVNSDCSFLEGGEERGW